MNYCCSFKKHFSLINEVNEIIIKYNEKNYHLTEFVNEHPTQKITVLIDVENESLFVRQKGLDEAKKLGLTIKVSHMCSSTFYQALKEQGIYFYSDWYAKDWEDIYYLLSLGVSEMYITEALGFDLERVANYLHKQGVQIRAFPNVAQVKKEDIIPDIKAFFIRPEDLSLYEKYIDTIEFWGDKPEIFYEIYAKDKHWYGELSEIIFGLKSELDSRFILPHFGERRIKCQRKCLAGEPCAICEVIVDCSKTLQKAGLLINIKEENENGKGSTSENRDN